MQSPRIIEANIGGARYHMVTNRIEPRPALPPARFRAELRQRYATLLDDVCRDKADGLCVFHRPRHPGIDLGVTCLSGADALALPDTALICAAYTAGAEALVSPRRIGHLRLETPGGIATADRVRNATGDLVLRVSSVPAFILGVDYRVRLPGIGTLLIDVVFDGAFYAVVSQTTYLASVGRMKDVSADICAQIMQQEKVVHPCHPHLSGLSRVLWPLQPRRSDAEVRSLTIQTGSTPHVIADAGISARAIHRTILGQSKWGRVQRHESSAGGVLVVQAERPMILAERPGGIVASRHPARLRELVCVGKM